MHRKVTAVRLELVDPATRTDKFYTIYTFDLGNGSYAVRSQYGARTSKGTLTRPEVYPSESIAADARRQQVRAKERKDYRPVEQWLSFGVPSWLDPTGPAADVLPVVADAFAAAWLAQHADTIAMLNDFAQKPRTPQALASGSVLIFANLPGQLATQPWGPALAAALDGLPRVDARPGKIPYLLSLVVAPEGLGAWSYGRYQHGLRTQARHMCVDADPADTVDVLSTAMSLWTPLDPSEPYPRLQTALEVARLVMAPPA